MKKIIFTILSSSILASNIMADQATDMSNLFLKSIKEVQLLDGRNLDFKIEVENLHLFENQVDYLELFNGEIVDRTDIKSIKRVDQHSMILKAIGVDGGG